MLNIPDIQTEHLLIRKFRMDDLQPVHELLDHQIYPPGKDLEARRDWLQWSVLNYEQLADLAQPPYGDRAVELRRTGQLIGLAGLVPCLNAFEQLGSFGARPGSPYTTEMGLYWAIAPDHRRQGFAGEAARALIDYAFKHLTLKRIVATTDYDNHASIGVMRKVGMRIERNPFRDPPWLQVVGVLENERRQPGAAGNHVPAA